MWHQSLVRVVTLVPRTVLIVKFVVYKKELAGKKANELNKVDTDMLFCNTNTRPKQ